MPEPYEPSPEQSKPNIEQEITRELFPVSREVVNIALKEIADNPELAMKEESALLMLEQPKVNQFLVTRAQQHLDGRGYITGALWTHRILRRQAEMNGIKIPNISIDDVMGYLRSELEKTRNGESTEVFQKRLMAELEINDPEMYRAIREITKYQPIKQGFIQGMSEVYKPVERKLKTQQMKVWVVGE